MLEEDSATLRELAKSCREAKERERLRALYALSIGQPVKTVADIFCVDESAVYRWIERWQEEKNLADKPKDGRPPSLGEKDREGLKRLLQEDSPKQHGINASFWDTKEIQAYLIRNGRDVSRETVRVCLKGMGAHFVKAQLKYQEANAELRRRFAEQFRKEAESKPNSVIVLFEDEMSAGCSPRMGYGWTFDKVLEIKAPQSGGRKKLNCFGAVNPLEGKVIQMSSSDSKAPTFVKFLRKIEEGHPGKVVWIYLDNLLVHKSAMVRDFLDKHNNIRLKFMPPYSPDLNPQEQWWNHQRRKLLNNRYFLSKHQLATSISWFGKLTPPEEIRSICSLEPIEKLLD